jgi:hypothetical protein
VEVLHTPESWGCEILPRQLGQVFPPSPTSVECRGETLEISR